jgi:phosphoglucomutase
MLEEVKSKAQKWLAGNFDENTKNEVKNLLENNEKELIESFYKDLEFGTGGLRGIMGVGTNRMNKYTVGMATQGLCNYLKSNFQNLEQISVAIAYDCRNNSKYFAEITAEIFSANNIKVYLFEDLRPTPELSFAIRHFGCQSGVVITASHNPKEYNGFKAYWEDGGQITSPHDKNIVNEALKVSVDDIKFGKKADLIQLIGNEIDEIYINKIHSLSLSPQLIAKHKNLKIVYTPIHGTGVNLVPQVLKKFGFENIFNVPEQDINDGNFPTVKSPNPENADALEMAIEKAKEVSADLVMATDPDADRVGIVVRKNKGEYILLNGNQTGTILIYYLLKLWKQKEKIKGKEYIVKTIVTTDILDEIAKHYKVDCYEVLTGFKYIAEIIKANEGKKTFIGGGEESYGYLAGEFIRDKDAVMACALIAEAAAWAKDDAKTLYDVLIDIYVEFGFYKEKLINIERHGKEGAEEITQMMNDFREDSPFIINNANVIVIKDYLTQKESNLIERKSVDIDLPKSNVLQFILEDNSKITVRPSGTEPKIKFYISVNEKLDERKYYKDVDKILDNRIKGIIKSLNLE